MGMGLRLSHMLRFNGVSRGLLLISIEIEVRKDLQFGSYSPNSNKLSRMVP